MEQAILVGVSSRQEPRSAAAQHLEELRELALSAGAGVRDSILQSRERLDPAYLIGRGKASEIAERVQRENLDLVIFDETLSPAQQRNLESLLQCKVLDRAALILDIFAQRARTREGKLQVELAQLNYLLPRLAGSSGALSRLGGGIGTRGPGETKLEMDRRRIRSRIAHIRSEIEKVRRHRHLHRARRQGIPVPVVTLVGYTNAGKSTLFTALTRSETLQSERMFATLDPLVRRIHLHSAGDVLLTDTVGFVRKLPPDLVAAFRATLEEIGEADLLLHVVDRSEENYREQIRAVEEILSDLGFEKVPTLLVFNKIDLIPDFEPGPHRENQFVAVSALKGTRLQELRSAMDLQLKAIIQPAKRATRGEAAPWALDISMRGPRSGRIK
ncbi:MAG TPA: GTPase HflX [Acidobacteriota bacterium]|jgi:GTP-binding protein HflX|nr:GTPase HflX [Acidobacteriota bacterium]